MSSLSNSIFKKSICFATLDALKIRNRIITYKELNEQALLVAAALLECGANNETIGIVGQRKASSYFGILGILYAGCNYTPINPKYNESRLTQIIEEAGIHFLVGAKEDIEMLQPLLIKNDKLPIEAIIIPEDKVSFGKKYLDEDFLKHISPLKNPINVESEKLAYILFTSGSTGTPKGVQVTNKNVLSYLDALTKLWTLEPGFKASQSHDFSFDPSVSDMFFTWTNGGTLCVLQEEELLMPVDFIIRENLDIWSSVPSVAAFMMKMGYLKPNAFPSLKKSRFAGEPLRQTIADSWQIAAPFSTVENHYGPTEATVDVSRHIYSPDQKRKSFTNSIVPIGKPLPDNEIVIIDSLGIKLSQGEIGEICFKGPQITKGYLNDKTKTDSVFVNFAWDMSEGKWYRSGDLGFYNADGNIECIGRRDNQVKLGGRRIEIGEIEAVLSRFPPTDGAVVVPLRDDNEIVIGCVAFITLKISKEDEIFIRKESLPFLEKVFFPKRIITCNPLPLSISGKIDRKALEEKAKQGFHINK